MVDIPKDENKAKEKPEEKNHGPGQDMPGGDKAAGPGTSLAERQALPSDPSKRGEEVTKVREITQQHLRDIGVAAYSWLTTCIIADGSASKSNDKAEGQDQQEKEPLRLRDMPKGHEMIESIKEGLPILNRRIKEANKEIKDPTQKKRLFDLKTLDEEWDKSIFGPESQRAWKESQEYLKEQLEKQKTKFSQIPQAADVKAIMQKLLPRINEQIEKENAAIKNPEQKKPLIDLKAIEQEWAEDDFGIETRKAWKATCDYMNKELVQGLHVLNARGFPLPMGVPLLLPKSASGSGNLETPEYFKAQLEAGLIKPTLGVRELPIGKELETDKAFASDMVKYINTIDCIDRIRAVNDCTEAISKANFLISNIQELQLTEKPLTGWLKLQGDSTKDKTITELVDQTTKDLRDAITSGDDAKLNDVVKRMDDIKNWTSAAMAWRDVGVAVQHYAAQIAALNAATRNDGVDPPSVAELRSWLFKGETLLKRGKMLDDLETFSDKGLESSVFRKIERNADHTLKTALLDMPETLDRNNPENLKNIETKLRWLAEHTPAVDRLMDEVQKDSSAAGEDVLAYQETTLKDPTDKDAPKESDYNATLKGFTVERCRKDGMPDENGDFYKINSYKNYLYKQWYAFYDTDYLGSVKEVKHVSLDPPALEKKLNGKIIGANDSVRVFDGERIRLVQGRDLPKWLSIKQEEPYYHRAFSAFIDIGFTGTALSKAKAGMAAARMLGAEELNIGMRSALLSLSKKEFWHAGWSGGLAATGLFRQAVLNNAPYGSGETIMWLRDGAVDIDMSWSLLPHKYSWQARLGNVIYGKTEEAAMLVKQANLPSSLLGKGVDALHTLYSGTETSAASRWLSGFAWADYSMMLGVLSRGKTHSFEKAREIWGTSLAQKLERTGAEHGKPLGPTTTRVGEQGHKFYSAPDNLDANKKISEPVNWNGAFDQYAQYLSRDAQPDPLMLRTKSVMSTPDNAELRKHLRTEATELFSHFDEREKTAGAIACLTLRDADNLSDEAGHIKPAVEYLKDRMLKSSDAHVRLAAADALMRVTSQYNQAQREAMNEYAHAQTMRKQADASLESLYPANDPESRTTAAAWLNKEIDKLERMDKRPGEYGHLRKKAEEQKEKADLAQAKLTQIDKFYEACAVDYADMASVCLSVLNDPNANRQQQIDALVTTTGPRLDFLLEAIKSEVEPLVNKSNSLRASFYGRGSATFETALKAFVANDKADADVRAVAMQVLVANAPTSLTVQERGTNGTVPALIRGKQITLGSSSVTNKQGVQANHAQARIDEYGDIFVRPTGKKDGFTETWVEHRDGKKEKLSFDWYKVKDGDQIILGDKESGARLELSDDRMQRFAELRLMADRVGSTGAMANSYSQQLTAQLQSSLTSPTSTSPEAISERWNKFLAVQSALASGIDAIGDNKKLIANALVQCIESNLSDLITQPELATRSMSLLNDDHIKALSPEQRQNLQNVTLSILRSSSNSAALMALKTITEQHISSIFAGADQPKLDTARTLVENLALKGNGAPSTPSLLVLRAQSLRTLAQMAPQRAALISGAFLAGGSVDNKSIVKDQVPIRLAALDVLEQVNPENLHDVVVKAQKTEKVDMAIISRLNQLEYAARPEPDESIALREFEAVRHRLASRLNHSFMEGGAEILASYAGRKLWEEIPVVELSKRALEADYSVNKDYNQPEAIKVRQALVCLAMQNNLAAAETLVDVAHVYGRKLEKELAGPLEIALQSNPQMDASTRKHLVDAYAAVTAGNPDKLAQEEKALVLLTVLQNSLRSMPRNPDTAPLEYESHRALHAFILDKVNSLPLDKMTPILVSLAQGPGAKAIDPSGFPTQVDYGADTKRTYTYNASTPGLVQSFTEKHSGKADRVFTYMGNYTWQDQSGEKITHAFVESKRSDQIGDLTYKDSKNITHVFRTNGSHIEIKETSGGKHVKVTYPGEKNSRKFVITNEDPTNLLEAQKMAVIDSATGQSEMWTKGLYDSFHIGDGKFPDDKLPINHRTLSSYPAGGDSLNPLQIERGDFTYVKGGVQYVFDSSGAEYKIENGHTVLTKPPDVALEARAHPMQNIRAYAASILARMGKSNLLENVAHSASQASDTDSQKAYESVKRLIVQGQKEATSDDWSKRWEDICKRNNLNLIHRFGLWQAQNAAAQVAEEQRGSIRRFFGEDPTKQQQARKDEIPKMWAQYGQFLNAAQKASDSSAAGLELRQAVAGVIFNNGECVPEDPKRAMSEAIDTMCAMSKRPMFGRADFGWVIAACLTEKPDLASSDQGKLVNALGNQIQPNGNLTMAEAADIIRLSLEQTYRSMPGADKPEERRLSLALQEKKLDKLKQWGNASHIPFITALAQEHSDPAVQEKAAQVRQAILQRSRSSPSQKKSLTVSK